MNTGSKKRPPNGCFPACGDKRPEFGVEWGKSMSENPGDVNYTRNVDFLIDHGELDGMSPERAFVLGAELVMVLRDWRETRDIACLNRLVHTENFDRIDVNLRRLGARVEMIGTEGDLSSIQGCLMKGGAT